METLVMIISILIITLVLLQSAKAEGASQAFVVVALNYLVIEKKEEVNYL